MSRGYQGYSGAPYPPVKRQKSSRGPQNWNRTEYRYEDSEYGYPYHEVESERDPYYERGHPTGYDEFHSRYRETDADWKGSGYSSYDYTLSNGAPHHSRYHEDYRTSGYDPGFDTVKHTDRNYSHDARYRGHEKRPFYKNHHNGPPQSQNVEKDKLHPHSRDEKTVTTKTNEFNQSPRKDNPTASSSSSSSCSPSSTTLTNNTTTITKTTSHNTKENNKKIENHVTSQVSIEQLVVETKVDEVNVIEEAKVILPLKPPSIPSFTDKRVKDQFDKMMSLIHHIDIIARVDLNMMTSSILDKKPIISTYLPPKPKTAHVPSKNIVNKSTSTGTQSGISQDQKCNTLIPHQYDDIDMDIDTHSIDKSHNKETGNTTNSLSPRSPHPTGPRPPPKPKSHHTAPVSIEDHKTTPSGLTVSTTPAMYDTHPAHMSHTTPGYDHYSHIHPPVTSPAYHHPPTDSYYMYPPTSTTPHTPYRSYTAGRHSTSSFHTPYHSYDSYPVEDPYYSHTAVPPTSATTGYHDPYYGYHDTTPHTNYYPKPHNTYSPRVHHQHHHTPNSNTTTTSTTTPTTANHSGLPQPSHSSGHPHHHHTSPPPPPPPHSKPSLDPLKAKR